MTSPRPMEAMRTLAPNRGLDHGAAADVHADMVDGAGVAGVVGEEHQVAQGQAAQADPAAFAQAAPARSASLAASASTSRRSRSARTTAARSARPPVPGPWWCPAPGGRCRPRGAGRGSRGRRRCKHEDNEEMPGAGAGEVPSRGGSAAGRGPSHGEPPPANARANSGAEPPGLVRNPPGIFRQDGLAGVPRTLRPPRRRRTSISRASSSTRSRRAASR
jgi:hypothetical protein